MFPIYISLNTLPFLVSESKIDVERTRELKKVFVRTARLRGIRVNDLVLNGLLPRNLEMRLPNIKADLLLNMCVVKSSTIDTSFSYFSKQPLLSKLYAENIVRSLQLKFPTTNEVEPQNVFSLYVSESPSVLVEAGDASFDFNLNLQTFCDAVVTAIVEIARVSK